MEQRHYKDYFTVPATYRANMTREAINETPDTWLDFYPHATFVELLNTVFEPAKSVWITGNFGTGKSNAALVIQKLFMDDESRVTKWFHDNASVIANRDALLNKLMHARQEGILVVYDYNASGIGPHEEFLVRLEKGIIAALAEHNYTVPGSGNLETVIERLQREGDHFFNTRDSIQSEMKSIRSDINTVDQLITLLREENTDDTPTHYLEDIQNVFHRDSIYLNMDASSFRAWVKSILEVNKLKRIVYIFDEFSEFIDANSSQLKTFEDVTEAPDINHFYLIPVTHKEPTAFLGENAPGARRAKDRFYFRNLTMPNDIAFRLASHAMKPITENGMDIEWKREKDTLWNSISTVVDRFNDLPSSASYVARQSFYDILPIHPMAAFLLKFLSEHARSNQRSIFEYLKGSADGREFQEFVAKGGPAIVSAQFLTPDYLWKYFMERSDAGQSKDIMDIRLEYDRIVAREYRNYDDTQAEIRILKTVLLFSLLARLAPEGHERLQPTVENVELSFRGDGTIMDVDAILRDMAENKHCFSIVNGSIDLYSSSVGSDELKKKMAELNTQFHELLTPVCQKAFEEGIKSARKGFSADRFDIRVSDAGHTTLTNITPATRDRYSRNLAKDNGSVCLWFVVAKDKPEQNQVRERSESIVNQLHDHRIIMLSFPDNTFCKENTNLWNEYIALYAQYLLENTDAAKAQIKKNFESIQSKWTSTLKTINTKIEVRYYNNKSGHIECEHYNWQNLKGFFQAYVESTLPGCPDTLTEQITVFSNKALKAWALAGIRFSGTMQQGQLVNSLKARGISRDDAWFTANPSHVLTQIRNLFIKKYNSTVNKGNELSFRKVYNELQRAPYGLRYNCLSAFVMGFCTSWMLEKNCQWTNKQLTYRLDEDTLAEMIESTVAEKNDKEKFICKLSKADKAFANRIGQMFNLAPTEDSTPLKALESVSAEVELSSSKVPLWVLAEYIRSTSLDNVLAADILDKLCVALRISSKGNSEEKTTAITEIGNAILENSDLVHQVAGYTRPENYIKAIHWYVDSAAPQLKKLAERVEDNSYAYCDMILKDAAPASGWLWNKSDISASIDKVYNNYKLMELARSILQITGYASYSEVLNRLTAKIDNGGLPYAIVGEKYPALQRLIEELNGNRDCSLMLDALKDCSSVIKDLYNDPQKKKALEIVRERAGDIQIDDNSLFGIVSELPSSADFSLSQSSDDYLKLIRIAVEKHARNVMLSAAKSEWARITQTGSIDEWHKNTRLPAWTVFAEDADDLVRVFLKPEVFATEALNEKLSLLQSLPVCNIQNCQDAFVEKMIPTRYARLGIKLSTLLQYLEKNYGTDPERWPSKPDIRPFINDQYQLEIAPYVVSTLKSKDPNVLKQQILELVQKDPDLGLKLLEL